MLGQLTPPFGIVLYVLMEVGQMSFDKLVKALIPFYIPILVVLALTIAFPPLVTWLPGLVIGR
jgi:TRAP-type C4-dicarboxylate transport system permease large subunit